MGAAIGVERTEQPETRDRLGQPLQAAHRAFLRDQEGREDAPRRVVERHDQVEAAIERRDPAMGRAVLEQQHAELRPARALLAVRRAPRRRLDQPRLLQGQPRQRVAQTIIVIARQMLVEVLHREVGVALPVQPAGAGKLARRRAPRRWLAKPPVGKTRYAFLLIAPAQAAKVTLRHPQHLSGLARAQATLAIARMRIFEPIHPGLP
jgi:hypothetical protein